MIERTFNKSLEEIWEEIQTPFIALNRDGYYAIIEKNPKEQKIKYNYNVYGKIDKSIKRLFSSGKKSQIIYDMPTWEFLTVYD
jgi:hypothetical protein